MEEQNSRTDWDAEYNFWHKIITGEVERFRFNQGYEPLEVELYPTGLSNPAFLGKTHIGRIIFRAIGRYVFDAEGKKVLKVEIRPMS